MIVCIPKDYSKRFDVNPEHDYMAEYNRIESEFNYRRMVSWLDCPHLQTEEKRVERLNMEKKYGKSSAIVKSMLYGQFQRSEDFNLIFSEDDLEGMKRAMTGVNKRIGTDRAAAGDPSGGGDGQILYLRLGTELLLQDDHNAGTGIKQAKYWVPLLREIGIKPWEFYIDSAGLGAEVANYIEDDMFYAGIVRIQPNVSPRFKHEFKDKYTEVLFFIKELITANVLVLKHNEKLLKQMRCRRFVMMDGHRAKAEDKKAHRKREKSSPDELDTLIYVFWDFDRSLLDVHVEQEARPVDENALTKMEKDAQSSSVGGRGAFSGMRSAAPIRNDIRNAQMMQKLRVGRR